MENNKTAVEYLLSKIIISSVTQYEGLNIDLVIEQAKQMEKEQIINAFNASRGTVHGELYYTSAESYYIENYNNPQPPHDIPDDYVMD